MDDLQFAKHIEKLRAAGKSGMDEMRDLLRQPGQLDRLITLAVRGAVRAKRSQPKTAPAILPAGFPDTDARMKAIAYWRVVGRQDLEMAIETVIVDFKSHFEGIKRPSWSGTWGTWFRNAPRFREVPRAGTPGAPNIIEGTSLQGWVGRLERFYGLDPDCPKGAWTSKFGPKRGEPGNLIPQAALDIVDARMGPRRLTGAA
jgi:hypothetical protein